MPPLQTTGGIDKSLPIADITDAPLSRSEGPAICPYYHIFQLLQCTLFDAVSENN